MRKIAGKTILRFHVNGQDREVAMYPFQTLLDVLRDTLGLTGGKPGCENGDCGACTVLMDGWPIKSCLCLAAEAAGHDIVTAEGLQNTSLHQAFADRFAMQCGYCTPGFVVNAYALLTHHPDPDDNTIDSWLQSNICRCTCYEEIGAAARDVIKQCKEAEI